MYVVLIFPNEMVQESDNELAFIIYHTSVNFNDIGITTVFGNIFEDKTNLI